ncbi:MAG: branched-chain amino acid aminotransferase [Candidatus Marinimicrobia bacterium]|nr:branched-chain amino acid aminotransferase [Candidatus Neomarinimicrobiota bacterium]
MGIDPKTIDWDSLGFNLIETRSMYKATCKKDDSWSPGELIPFGNIELSPAAGVLNYGQGVFEGMKAYRTLKNRIVLFRPEMNAKRISMSTKRLCIPEMDEELFLKAAIEIVKDNVDYIPPYGKGSLYLRPVVWGTGPVLGVKPADEYTFIIFASPVGPYFKGNIKPLHLKVTHNFHRAAPKGIGNAKAIGNYSASLYPSSLAKKTGFDEVIYLNAGNEQLIEEVGSANMFIVKDNVLKTPRLAGSILPGVTRDSVLTLAKEKLDIEVQETDVLLDEVCSADEVFCTGTAVVVTPVGKITSEDGEHSINDGKIGIITHELRSLLLGIQREECEDTLNWLHPID